MLLRYFLKLEDSSIGLFVVEILTAWVIGGVLGKKIKDIKKGMISGVICGGIGGIILSFIHIQDISSINIVDELIKYKVIGIPIPFPFDVIGPDLDLLQHCTIFLSSIATVLFTLNIKKEISLINKFYISIPISFVSLVLWNSIIVIPFVFFSGNVLSIIFAVILICFLLLTTYVVISWSFDFFANKEKRIFILTSFLFFIFFFVKDDIFDNDNTVIESCAEKGYYNKVCASSGKNITDKYEWNGATIQNHSTTPLDEKNKWEVSLTNSSSSSLDTCSYGSDSESDGKESVVISSGVFMMTVAIKNSYPDGPPCIYYRPRKDEDELGN